jgi:hypothetical protein
MKREETEGKGIGESMREGGENPIPGMFAFSIFILSEIAVSIGL